MPASDRLSDYELFNGQVPFSLEAEQSVLGAVLVEPSCLDRIVELIKPDYFYREQHQQIYTLMLSKFTLNETIDIITVLDACNKENIFATSDDAKLYLTQLVQLVPSTSGVEAYARIIKEKYYLRSLIRAAGEISRSASEPQADAASILELAEARIYDIREGRDTGSLTPISRVLTSTYDRLQKISGENRKDYLGIPSGFSGVDAMLTGLNKSDLILIGGRPGMGKTAFALNIAANVASHSGKAVAIFSLEMSREQLVERLLSTEACVDSKKLRTGNLTDSDWASIASAAGRLNNVPIYIDESSDITVGQMKAKLRRIRNLGLVVIDYLQLMKSGNRSENRVQEVSEITRGLKLLAKELNIPLITCSQLNRDTVKSRNDQKPQANRPQLSDLRESGSIEQDADIVMLLHRNSYYSENAEDKDSAECIIAKNRHGETGTVELHWDGVHTRFISVERTRREYD